MAKGVNQKLKLYRLADIMLKETDEEHGLTVNEIISLLAEYGISAERKTIYDDLALLDEIGLCVEKQRGGKDHSVRYYIVKKQFEMAELKLLADAIECSRFITAAKSKALIDKLMNFTSKYEARQLDRQVYVAGRIKTMNESIYYNVDEIYNAIADNRRISFEYLMWDINKKLIPRKDRPYIVSPWGLSWYDENYYLIAYDSKAGIIKHYRVDKMRRILMLNEPRDGGEHFESFDMASYTNMNFGMFAGAEESVRIRFNNSIIGVLLDRFGTGITIYPVDDEYSDTIVKVAVSGQFFGWIFALGGKAKIVSPDRVVERYIDILNGQLKEQPD